MEKKKNLNSMQAKNLQVELNKGTGMNGLCAIYDATEEEIRSHIRRLYNQSKSKTNDIFAQLKKNDAKAARKQRKNSVNNDTIATAPVEETVAVEVQEETFEEAAPSLVKMQEQAKMLSDEVVDIEVAHESLRTRRSNLKVDMCELSNRLTKLRKQIVEIGTEYRIKAEEFNQIAGEMLTLSKEKALKIGKLDELNAQIARLQTIELFIYDDGNVVAENRSDIVLDDSGYEATYEELLRSDKDYLDLKKSQLMVLARVICIVNNLGCNASIELSFDDEAIELAYGLLSEVA